VYPRLKEYLIESTGLAYYADKDDDLVRRLRRRLANFGFQSCAPYLELLRDSGRGPSEMDALIEEITIGETYFFRHREHFDALRDLVLPDLIARKATSRRLRMWCAGCADGAEPYSLSILLRRELPTLMAGWDLSILGTDINRQCLATAREGRFDRWCLRSTPESVRRDCFSEQGKQWVIAPEYKIGLSFQSHNLVDDGFPPPFSDSVAFDLIICRNVMIYFDSTLTQKTTRHFHDCLAPGGWLLVGPSEPNMTCFTSFQVVNAPGVTLYRRPDHSDEPDFAGQVQPIASPLPTVPPPIASLPLEPRLEAAEPHILSPSADQSPPTLADLRQRADQGDWENAARCGEKLLEFDNLNALAHFHYALVLEQMGNFAESERALRKAIYLDRQAVLAHFHLGRLLRAHGDLRQAERCFTNALNLLSALSSDEILTDADGIKVSELRKLAETQIENLRVQV
jgi:chemotaxis protein methyltransferase CheR